MAQVTIQLTFDSAQETMAQVLTQLQGKAQAALTNEQVKASNVNTSSDVPSNPASKADAPTTAAPKADTPTTPAPKADAPTNPASKADAPSTATPKVDVHTDTPNSVAETEAPRVTKTEIRALATTLSKAVKREELKAIFAAFGCAKLSEIAETDYPKLKERLVAAND